MSRTSLKVADLVEARGVNLGASEWVTIKQPRIDQFADATGDHQWIHVDPSRAAAGPFGTTIAHGYLTLGMIPELLGQLLGITDEVRGTNYGLEKVRFIAPVRVDSDIRLRASILRAYRRPDGAVAYHVSATVEGRDADRPVAVAEVVYLTYGS